MPYYSDSDNNLLRLITTFNTAVWNINHFVSRFLPCLFCHTHEQSRPQAPPNFDNWEEPGDKAIHESNLVDVGIVKAMHGHDHLVTFIATPS